MQRQALPGVFINQRQPLERTAIGRPVVDEVAGPDVVLEPRRLSAGPVLGDQTIPIASMRPFVCRSRSREHDRSTGSASRRVVFPTLRIAPSKAVSSFVSFPRRRSTGEDPSESRLIAPQEPAVAFSVSRSLSTGPLVDSRPFPTPAGPNRPARPDHIAGLLTNALKTQSHTRLPFFSSLGWTIMEWPEIRLTIAIAVSFSSSMSWAICPSTSVVPIGCSRWSPPDTKRDRS